VRIPSSAVRVAVGAALAAACSHPQPATTPAPQGASAQARAAPGQTDLTGDWAVQLIQQGLPANPGTLHLVPSGDGYRGNLLFESANQPYFVRNAQAQGDHITIILDTPDGDARIEGTLRAPTEFEGLYTSRTLNGRLTMSRR